MNVSTSPGGNSVVAKFNPLIRPYLVITIGFSMVVTVLGILPENIQDASFVEGPVLRHFHLSTLKFETA